MLKIFGVCRGLSSLFLAITQDDRQRAGPQPPRIAIAHVVNLPLYASVQFSEGNRALPSWFLHKPA